MDSDFRLDIEIDCLKTKYKELFDESIGKGCSLSESDINSLFLTYQKFIGYLHFHIVELNLITRIYSENISFYDGLRLVRSVADKNIFAEKELEKLNSLANDDQLAEQLIEDSKKGPNLNYADKFGEKLLDLSKDELAAFIEKKIERKLISKTKEAAQLTKLGSKIFNFSKLRLFLLGNPTTFIISELLTFLFDQLVESLFGELDEEVVFQQIIDKSKEYTKDEILKHRYGWAFTVQLCEPLFTVLSEELDKKDKEVCYAQFEFVSGILKENTRQVRTYSRMLLETGTEYDLTGELRNELERYAENKSNWTLKSMRQSDIHEMFFNFFYVKNRFPYYKKSRTKLKSTFAEAFRASMILNLIDIQPKTTSEFFGLVQRTDNPAIEYIFSRGMNNEDDDFVRFEKLDEEILGLKLEFTQMILLYHLKQQKSEIDSILDLFEVTKLDDEEKGEYKIPKKKLRSWEIGKDKYLNKEEETFTVIGKELLKYNYFGIEITIKYIYDFDINDEDIEDIKDADDIVLGENSSSESITISLKIISSYLSVQNTLKHLNHGRQYPKFILEYFINKSQEWQVDSDNYLNEFSDSQTFTFDSDALFQIPNSAIYSKNKSKYLEVTGLEMLRQLFENLWFDAHFNAYDLHKMNSKINTNIYPTISELNNFGTRKTFNPDVPEKIIIQSPINGEVLDQPDLNHYSAFNVDPIFKKFNADYNGIESTYFSKMDKEKFKFELQVSFNFTYDNQVHPSFLLNIVDKRDASKRWEVFYFQSSVVVPDWPHSAKEGVQKR